MPLASVREAAGEAVVVFIRHLAVGEAVGFTPHLPVSMGAAVWAGSIHRLVASMDLLLTVARTRLTLVMHRVFMDFLHMLCTRTG
jgi:hypothetical protein